MQWNLLQVQMEITSLWLMYIEHLMSSWRRERWKLVRKKLKKFWENGARIILLIAVLWGMLGTSTGIILFLHPQDIYECNKCILNFAGFFGSQIRGHVEQMGFCISSCGEDMIMFRRCLAASFFLNAALKQPEGTYR